MQNMIIARFNNGKVLKGTTADLFPNKAVFHLKEDSTEVIHEIDIHFLKAIYFVKSFEGDPEYDERKNIDRVGLGKKIMVRFKDGETLVGYTQGYAPNRDIFIVFPCDPECNNQKVFVIANATTEVSFV